MLLGSVAMYLLFAAELFFVHDLFGNRMNTVFKFYYQAWILLSVVGGYGAYVWWKHGSRLKGPAQAISTASLLLVLVLVLGRGITSVTFATDIERFYPQSHTATSLSY